MAARGGTSGKTQHLRVSEQRDKVRGLQRGKMRTRGSSQSATRGLGTEGTDLHTVCTVLTKGLFRGR